MLKNILTVILFNKNPSHKKENQKVVRHETKN